jgi:predicted dehydrogenase
MTATRPLGVGLIGTGFMGKAHALAWRSAGAIFGDLPEVRLECLCDTPADKAGEFARQFGFDRATDDWRTLVADPAVDVVSIATPNSLHKEMAQAALAAGKHVWCEKPMALTVADAAAMAQAARAAGRRTQVGYNYVANPAFTHAQRLIEGGTIGRIVHLRGWVDEDYQADPQLAWTWRARIADAGLGTLGDLGCHLVSLLCGLAGPIDSVLAEIQTVHPRRPLPDGEGYGEVENEDVASALLRFASGVHGVFMSSRSAWGRKNSLGFEVHGTKGMIIFEQERMNELRLYVNEGPKAEQGFRTILTGPEHPPFGAFVPAPGHQLGFNDLKAIELAGFLRAIAGGPRNHPDFEAALDFEKVIHAIARSSHEGRRVTIAEIDT